MDLTGGDSDDLSDIQPNAHAIAVTLLSHHPQFQQGGPHPNAGGNTILIQQTKFTERAISPVSGRRSSSGASLLDWTRSSSVTAAKRTVRKSELKTLKLLRGNGPSRTCVGKPF